jgi:transglutaminase-like putative cysteine protease
MAGIAINWPALAGKGFWLLPPLLALLPHLPHLPPWLAATCLGLWLWRALLEWSGRPLPHRHLRSLLALAGLGGVLLQFGQVFGQQAGIPLFLLLIFVKLLESGTPREKRLLLLLNYFTVLSHFLTSQSLPVAAYMLGVALLLSAALAQLANGRTAARPLPESLRTAAALMLAGLPLAVLLFVFFPRLDHPLWSLPSGERTARTGLSDSMSPGDFGRLIQSGEVAFRAVFQGPAPDPRGLYWRGPVLSDFDGRAWRVGRREPLGETPTRGLGTPLTYTLTLEPHERDWLFTLGLPAPLPPGTQLLAGMQLVAAEPVRQRRRLDVTSHPDYRLGAGGAELARALALPADFNPRARQLAARWRAEARGTQEIVDRALALYRESFTYTLAPPSLGLDSVDQFLFDTRRGFCEHFAGGFVFLMRAAGIPARVVTGYQGGELNPIDGHVLVRQSEAHAWAEVWLPERGWTQVDPTASVAPARVELGLAAALPARELPAALARLHGGWLRGLGHVWESVNHGWNQWVLGYSLERQLRLLTRLSPNLPRNAATLAGLSVLAGLAVMLWLAWRAGRQPENDPALKLYLRLQRRLRLPTRPGEDPRQYARRAGLLRPEVGANIARLCELYEQARYGDRPDALEALRQGVAGLGRLSRGPRGGKVASAS